MYHTLDIHFQGLKHVIAAFVVESSEGPILIESGPYSAFHSIEAELGKIGYKLEDINHVLLSHIHFDHAGAAWAFAEKGATIYLHPFGADHLHDPTKLVASATMIYGDQMDVLWGEMKGIPRENLKTMAHEEELVIGEQKFTSLHTPGHAKHHIAWEWEQTIFAGDVAGVKIENGPVVPPCPPPDIDIEDWIASIDLILSRNPARLALTHFAEIENVTEHMTALKNVLKKWSAWIKSKMDEGLSREDMVPQFMAYTNNELRERGISEEGFKQYEAANPAWMSVAGLMRYWKKMGG